MKLLLDTHVFIWLSCEPERLPAGVVEACESGDNQVVLSVVSVLEMEIKLASRRLVLPMPPDEMLSTHRRENDLAVLDLRLAHVHAFRRLPPVHKDPFDRLLVAQALAEDAVLVSGDKRLSGYPVKILW
jgi:PIN domain nuclease of toxin-antitoxin system